MEETKVCCICGKEFKGYGNNPWPVKEEGECCDQCNWDEVIPARVRESNERERYDLQCEINETMADDIGF